MPLNESLDDATVFAINYGNGLALDIGNGETWLPPMLA